MSGESTVRAGRDTWVGEGSPAQNHFGAVNLQIGRGTAGDDAYSYMYFQNPAPRGATIKQALLRFYTRDQWGTGQTRVDVQRLGRSTKFSRVTWNTRPGVVSGGHVSSVTQANPAPFTLYEVDVSVQLQNIANGAANYGFQISSPSTTRRSIVSFDAGTHRPTLYVAWSDRPQAPTGLVPSGGGITARQFPVLQWDYVDVSGNTDMAALEVQIDDNASWSTSVNWDSGVIVADTPELDMATTNWGGLSEGMTRYWRVRHQDGAGLWSRWSHRADGNGARMTRRDQGRLELLAPTGGVVDDFTPTIVWNFGIADANHPARDQAQWRIILCDPDDPTREYWRSGRRTAGTDGSKQFQFTLPSRDVHGVRPLNRWGRRYRLIVDVWDSYVEDRVRTPHDPTYVRATHDFVLRDTPGVSTRPENLRGDSDPNHRPYLILTWRASGVPDEWRILRGGGTDPSEWTLIHTAHGADLLTNTPGLYRWTDRDATPNQTHTWHVRAFHNGQTSQPASWQGRIHTDHAWLVDWDSDRIVPILDPDISFEMPDTSATYEPIASESVVRVTAVQRGMQGSVAGRLVSWPDRANGDSTPLADWEENFVWMKAHPGRDYRLMVGNRTWRVLIGDAVLSPMRIPDSAASAVSFSFWSLGGPPEP